MISSGPKSLGVFFLSLFSLPLFFVCLCSVVSFILIKMYVMNLYFSSGEFCFFLAIIQPSFPAQQVVILSHTLPRLCHSHLCLHLVRFSGSSFIILACRDCHHLVLLHLYTFFSEKITAFTFFIAYPLRGAPHTFRNFFTQKGQAHLHPYLPGHITCSRMVLNPRLVFSSFQTE